MSDGINVKILGDFGPFSRMGKSIGYLVSIGKSNYLVDCGAPLFQQIGGHGLKTIKGMIITHSHDDHKRWYSDLALFNMYAPDIQHKVALVTGEEISEELRISSAPALDRSLSHDSKTIVDIAYEEYVDCKIIGPRPKYKIVYENKGKPGYFIKDRKGNILGPDKAKIVLSHKTKRPRILFKDPDYKEWIEPESFYDFSSKVFYEKEQNIFKDPEGFTLQAIKSPVWHGIPGIGLKIKTDSETLIFSSDTVHNKELWAQLYTEKKTQKLDMTRKKFESASVIYGDINHYIERMWSKERYESAKNAFNDAIVIHDVSTRKSVVHTDYERLGSSFLKRGSTILTHSPDRITSEWALCNSGKAFRIKGKKFYEVAGGKLFKMNADIFHKEDGRYFVGYKNDNGEYLVYEKNGLLGLAHIGSIEAGFPTYGLIDVIETKTSNINFGNPLYRVDMYEDVSGKYFPMLNKKNVILRERKDGRVESIKFTENGSIGTIVEDCRERVEKLK